MINYDISRQKKIACYFKGNSEGFGFLAFSFCLGYLRSNTHLHSLSISHLKRDERWMNLGGEAEEERGKLWEAAAILWEKTRAPVASISLQSRRGKQGNYSAHKDTGAVISG